MAISSVCVLGAGSWGTALAHLIACNGFSVSLWDRSAERIEAIAETRRNDRYLPGLPLSDAIVCEADLARAAAGRELMLLAVPSHAFAACLAKLRSCLQPPYRLVWGTKGLDPHSGRFLHQVARDCFGPEASLAALSGPTFAIEVMKGLPTAITAASPDMAFAEAVAALLRNPFFRVYTNDDLLGVQLGGAVKNVLAIAAGVSDGMGFGANARAALVTRGLAEMMRLGDVLGAKPKTLMGLAGVGDLILTCTDDQSRNRRLGLGLGQGHDIETVKAEIGQEIEGIGTARLIRDLARHHGVEMPIVEQVHALLYEGVAPQTAVRNLLLREPKPEAL
ncbi:glycerol-3-phosphate dehydrogenase (NAD(P)+) [Methylomarinovum tepidoasis]|uniref:Glycerol-3-phosphate dehydrogenase [NAD(P)+] n=1 Tax=Methylomarinovum tepidoasis TaxID=2840183 RepID=A0AAU9CB34_9GAMM|nr:NAD(P)H-dependent glycerol-3-phosphate dehydrogenase [Methylomarinovum sp. IN45]BCX87871.1 glycerol-3-phosphate dehydrogenase (NAD(P)+) [Methylomarinovum sp. IN45]